ncbi:MAG TPA: YceI family protein [Acidimicrobiales bacterium]|nr:YceI family protein [Acidimicrobiales bacterium]
MTDLSTDTESPELTHIVDGREVPAAGTYHLDPSHTTVDFVARHLMVTKVRGTFPAVTGRIVVGEDPTASHLEVDVEVASVTTRDDKRDEHLRSADFFDTEKFPTMRFVADRAVPDGDNWVVEGDLTIKATTRPVRLAVEFLGAIRDPWGGSRLGFSASTEVNREDFGLGWNVALEAGGVVVSKTARIEIESELVKEA